jgi:hypothetical protein
MKIAICLSGLVRTYRETYENFKEALINPNLGHEIDIFISTWPIEFSNNSLERTRRLSWYGEQAIPFPENPIDYTDLITKYNPTSINVEKPITFKADWFTPTAGVNIQSMLSMAYKIYACDCLRRQYEQAHGFEYDVVMRARFDCLFPISIKIDDKFDLSVITTPSMMQPRFIVDWDWLNDKFAVGTRSIMSTYSDWYLNLEALVMRGVPIQPETLLAAHLKEAGIGYTPWGSEMEMVRPAGY